MMAVVTIVINTNGTSHDKECPDWSNLARNIVQIFIGVGGNKSRATDIYLNL